MCMESALLKARWDKVIEQLSVRFSRSKSIDLEEIIYLVGLQELGQADRIFKKDEKINLMHVGICTLLEPYGYYRFDRRDEEGWPHFSFVKPLPPLQAGEQALLMKEAIVEYFLKAGFVD